MKQFSYSEPAWQALQGGVQGQDTVDAHRKDVSIAIAPNYGGAYPIEQNSIHTFLRWQVDLPSTNICSWNNPFASSAHPTRLTTTSPVFSNADSVNLPTSTARIGSKHLPFGWSISEAMASGATDHLGQTSIGDIMADLDLDDLIGYNQSQQAHEDPTKREGNHPSSTLFDLSRVWTLEPSSRSAETQASTHIVKSSNRHICTICFKSHTRPSRAIACENGHLGYQPFVCDGTCDNSAW
ncbi:hypothetical protein FRC19_001770 [Serendipita sp. 401]|nr:hypothetical protein FRC19_001770 [Serendipita sp. 401]KAG9050093.1 hypothetical protein FS842_011405 [Serendipita sp. 407]